MPRATSSIFSELQAVDRPRVAVLRALMLGDLLCAVPALRAMRAALPRAAITLIGLPWAAAFVERFWMYIDEFIEFPGYPGLPERACDPAAVVPFLSDVQKRRYDLAIQMHGSGEHVNSLIELFGARRIAGYRKSGGYCPNDASFLSYPDHLPEIRRHLTLMNFLGAPGRDECLEFPLTNEDCRSWKLLTEENSLRIGRTVCLHPGARYASRRWSPANFAAVADALAAEGYDIVITGTKCESPLADELTEATHYSVVNLVGRTSVGELACVVQNARLVISNDTGMAHLADAVGTPSVVVVLSSDAARWAPLDARRHRIVVANVDCRPCEYVDCPIGHICDDAVTPDDVLAAAEHLLNETERAARPPREAAFFDSAMRA